MGRREKERTGATCVLVWWGGTALVLLCWCLPTMPPSSFPKKPPPCVPLCLSALPCLCHACCLTNNALTMPRHAHTHARARTHDYPLEKQTHGPPGRSCRTPVQPVHELQMGHMPPLYVSLLEKATHTLLHWSTSPARPHPRTNVGRRRHWRRMPFVEPPSHHAAHISRNTPTDVGAAHACLAFDLHAHTDTHTYIHN